MKLTELQKKITPGPYEPMAMTKTDVPKGTEDDPLLCGVKVCEQRSDGKTTIVFLCGQGIQSAYDAAYLAHCANQLPKVVVALNDALSDPGMIWADDIRSAALCAIAAAEEVEGI